LTEEGSPGASFGEEVLEESNSSRRFLFFSYLGLALQNSQEEGMKWSRCLPKKLRLHLRPTLHQPRGLQKQQRQDSPELAPPLEEENKKPKIGGSTKESVTKLLVNKHKTQEGKEIRSRHRQVTKHIPRVKDEWSRRNQLSKLGSLSPL
jgi:hypothetical protein